MATWKILRISSSKPVCAQTPNSQQIRAEKRRQLLLHGDDQALRSSPPEVLVQTLDALLRVLGNLLANPQEPKYRLLRASNPTLRATVFSRPGA